MYGVVRCDIDTRVDAVNDRRVGNPTPQATPSDISNQLAAPVINPQIGDSHDHEFATRGTCSRAVSPVDAIFAAGALLSTSAILTTVVGLFALTANELVASGPGYEYTFEITGWGWANILTGLVLAAVAVALFLSATWARVAAIIVTCLAIVVTFLWMPYYPTGAIVLIALDTVAIWGVATRSPSRDSA